MSQYDKQRQHKVDYKEYTLDDYKKLKKEVRLGGLGPDLENESFRHKVRCRLCGLYHLIDLMWHHRLVTVFLVFSCKRPFALFTNVLERGSHCIVPKQIIVI